MKDYKYKIRCDLAFKNKTLKNTRTTKSNNIIIKKFTNNLFNFTDIMFDNIETIENTFNLKKALNKELFKYFYKYKIKKTSSFLIIGLGNINIASDSLGSKTLFYINATSHLKALNLASNMRSVSCFIPGVTKDTGFSAFKSIKALTKELKPDFILIIDSLISDSITYLNKLIQITDSGITPGSGINNYGEEISLNTLKIPVITVGVPTAIEASSIIKDALNIQENELTFKEGYDLIVSSKDIDIFINKMSKLIGETINEVLSIS